MKIVSLVPSLTEILFDFGLTSEEVVGRTKFCIHPKNKVQDVAIIGGTKNINIEKIKSLNPDIILANKEENVKEQVEELMQTHKVIVTHVETLEDNYYLLKNLGNLFNKKEIAQHFNLKIQEQFNFDKPKVKLKVAYLIWKDPYMSIGRDTFIHHILQDIGFENFFANQKRYPSFELTDLAEADVIFLSSEPYPFKEKHVEELQKIYPNKIIKIVDGEAFSWYGTRIAHIGDYYQNLVSEILKSK
ncbi:ABC-type Fe3+-hydroxamate transport system, substrate-binding protein [Soonwooa buanensis]|uniref:ABC-type Fe3+-hydroxamate transport system, substrate-binding protein n=1 Tax=Soonwooa buanensis TaxID=619805 RepID=A0A1T5F668_9FLAO|nr:helical backbone metal receptor [Soonwooa buanensis]SKB91654.1 ABC-type Fe3+-hydroxamate transport system, substrate-binding protein [Soonwooa buanensis]